MRQKKAEAEPRSFRDDRDDAAEFDAAPIDEREPLRLDCPGDVAVI